MTETSIPEPAPPTTSKPSGKKKKWEGESFEDGIRRVAKDLYCLEINTVLKENMTARKMPDPIHALLDISHVYTRKLLSLGLHIAPLFSMESEIELRNFDGIEGRGSEQKTNLDDLKINNKPITFLRLRYAASHGASLERFREDKSTVLILDRIKRNCDQLKNMVRKYDDEKDGHLLEKTRNDLLEETTPLLKPGLKGNEMTLLRKIWEIGVEQVVMQTVIQIDGDVITRVQTDFAKPEFDYLFNLHQHGVKASLNQWHMLVKTVGSFFINVAKMFKKK